MITITNPEGFAYTEEGHAYTFNGAPVLSITQIMRSVGISPDFKTVAPDVLSAAAERGTNVHSLTQFYDEDDLGDVDPAYKGYLDAWISFRKAHEFVPEVIEQMVYHPTYRFAGRPDRAGLLRGVKAVVEIKTGKGTLDASVGIQLSAQAVLLDKFYPGIKKRVAVKLHDDGSYDYREFLDHTRDKGVFLAAATVANYKGR